MTSIHEPQSIVDFIKTNYPKVTFSPFKFAYKRAVGFIVSNNNLIIGFINKNGTLCKLIEPINLEKIGNGQIQDIIKRIPIVEGFTQNDKNNLLNMFGTTGKVITQSEHDKIVKELQQKTNILIKDKELQYKILYDSSSNKTLSIQKEYQDKINILQQQYNNIEKQNKECKLQIINQKDEILKGINSYKEQVKDYIQSKDLKFDDLKRIHTQVTNEKNVLENKLKVLVENEKKHLQTLEANKNLIDNYNEQIKNLKEKYNQLIQNNNTDLNSLKNKYNLQIQNNNNEIEKLKREFNIQLQSKNKGIQELKNKYDMLSNKNKDLDILLGKCDSQLQFLQSNPPSQNIEESEENDFAVQLENKNREIEELKNGYTIQLEKAQKANDLQIQYSVQLDNKNKELEYLQREYDLQLQKNNNSTSELHDKYNLELENKNKEIEDLKREINLQVENAQKATDLQMEYRTELENKNTEIEDLKREFKIQLEKAKNTSNLQKEFNTQLENKNREIENLQSQFNIQLEKAKNISNIQKEYNLQIQNKNTEIENLKREFALLSEKGKDTTQLQREFAQELQNKNKQIDDLQNEFNLQLQEKSRKLEEITNDYNFQLDNKNKEIEDLKREFNIQLEKVQNTTDLQKEYNIELQNKNREIENLQNEFNLQLEDRTRKLKELTNNYNLELDNKNKEIEYLKNQYNIQLDQKSRQLQELANNSDLQSNENQSKIKELMNTIDLINNELGLLKEELSKSEMKRMLLEGYKSRCEEKLINEKNLIINKIQEYNQVWNQWSENIRENADKYKYNLANELNIIQQNLKLVLQRTNLKNNEHNKLKQTVKEIQAELQKTITEQLISLSAKDDQIQNLEEKNRILQQDRENNMETIRQCKNLEMESMQKEKQIQQLRKELEEVKRLLLENSKMKIQSCVDYDDCFSILQNFSVLNNIFYRKQEVIKRLESIIYGGIGNFINLNDVIKNNIKSNFENVKTNIMKHIQFLDLEKYLKSNEFQLLKNKATRPKVSADFCIQLINILEYWNENKGEYREQDRLLTNIYEDLSGAVRVYIRIKPLIGNEQKLKTISISAIDSKKQRSVTLDCSAVQDVKNNIKKSFGEFYGVFEESFTNQDVYTGIESLSQTDNLKINLDEIVESSDTISPGLYSTFKQVEDGYSIVIFGYGLSGSGKSFTLLGSNGVPGILHYGLANLNGVRNIKLKYLFEQYYRAVDVNFAKVRGNIHNLIREVPQMRKYARNENEEFATKIPSNIDINALKVENIFKLTDIIDQYRTEKGRIKKTPNNPVSSRSHLYLVFEITFDTGKVGYITIVDTAGRESPLDIYNTFIDTSKTKLASVMAPEPVGGETNIIKSKRDNLDPIYTPKHIYEVLKEGFYINETINHLVYFFNKKNYRNIKITLQPTDPTKYTVNKYYVSPITEENSINESNNCLTIPIMKFLDNLSNRNMSEIDFKPTKFIMMCMVRQEEKYCDQTFETLEFANNVKSS